MAPCAGDGDAPVGRCAARPQLGGYGFGLRIWQTCAIRHQVAHSGGLPGYGSHMRWLPEHGVGIIALGNLTYTSWTRVVDDAIDALARSGGFRRACLRPRRLCSRPETT